MNVIYVYGAGSLGAFVAGKARARGVVVHQILDPARAGTSVEGLDVVHPEEAQPNRPVWIAVLNNHVDIAEVIASLGRLGFSEILSPPQVFLRLGDLGADASWYWLESNSETVRRDCDSAIQSLAPLLSDEDSGTLERIVRYRRLGQADDAGASSAADLQYLDRPGFWDSNTLLVDGGSYTGDTLRALCDNGYCPDSAIAFEPNPGAFRMLVDSLDTRLCQVVCVNAALSDVTEIGGSSFGSGTGFSVDKDVAGRPIPLIALDDFWHGARISHIKLDLEGGEDFAIAGMSSILRRDRPRMAVAAYHRSRDLGRLPVDILKAIGETRVGLGNYANQTFETVLYFEPL